MNDIDQASPADESSEGAGAASAGMPAAAPAGRKVNLRPDEEIGDEGIPQYDAGDDSILRDAPPAAGADSAAPQAPPSAAPAAPSTRPASP